MGANTDSSGKGGLLAAGGSLISSGIQWASQGSMNKKTRKWNEEMYGRQRADALQDWEMQNAYNTPAAQMQRFKDAGLNPHLIYGQSNEGATVRSTDVKSWQPHAPQFDAGSAIGAYYDTQMRAAQVDNVKQDTILKAAAVVDKLATKDTRLFDLEMKQALKDTTIDLAKARKFTEDMKGNKLQWETDYLHNKDIREQASNDRYISESVERVLRSQQARAQSQAEMERIQMQIKLMKQDERIKEIDAKTADGGFRPNDPFYWRQVEKVMQYLKGKGIKVP